MISDIMKHITILIDEKTKKAIDKKRGDLPLSVFLRKDLETRYK